MRGVVASETRAAQTGAAEWSADLCRGGVVRPAWWPGGSHDRVTNHPRNRTPLERAAAAGESPVGVRGMARGWQREYGGARAIPSEAGVTTSQG